MEFDSVDEGSVVNWPCMGGSSSERFEVRFARPADVGVVDDGERDQLDRVDLDLAVTNAIVAPGFYLRPPPQPERHRDVSGQHVGTKFPAELHGFTLRQREVGPDPERSSAAWSECPGRRMCRAPTAAPNTCAGWCRRSDPSAETGPYDLIVSVDIQPATPDRWSDVVAAFGRRGRDPSWCWCRRFLENSEPGVDNREELHKEVAEASVPPGLLAYVNDQPVGWTRVGLRSEFPGVTGNRALAKVLSDDPGAWWVVCFVVDRRSRHSGVGTALLEAAVAFARDHGATAVEGHPVDVAALRSDRVSGTAIFTGTLTMFAAAGFHEIGRTFSSRPVVRRVL
jgi:GNAT superfamily N-acetyltransferase